MEWLGSKDFWSCVNHFVLQLRILGRYDCSLERWSHDVCAWSTGEISTLWRLLRIARVCDHVCHHVIWFRYPHGLIDGKRHLLYKMWLLRKQDMNHWSQVQWCMLSKVLWSLLQTANLASPAWGEFVMRVQLTYCMVQMSICTLIHNKTLHCFVHYQLCRVPEQMHWNPQGFCYNIRASPLCTSLRFSLPLPSWRWCH